MGLSILLFAGVLSGLSGYVTWRLAKTGIFPKKRMRLVAGGTVLLAISGQFVYRFYPKIISYPFATPYFWIGGVLFGALSCFLAYSIFFDLLSFIVSRLPQRETSQPRRLFFTKLGNEGVLAATAASTLLGLWTAKEGARIKEVSIPIPNLDKDLQGLRIAQITDLHVGPLIMADYVRDVVRTVQMLKPDLIFMTGDLADGKVDELRKHLEPLAELSAPLGVYYVTGNHEYYWGGLEWIALTKELGWIPLLNENRILSRGDARFMVAGVPDPSAHRFVPEHLSSPKQAVLSSEKVSLKILLAHRPNSCFEAEEAGFDVQFSGHTHGGQYFPWSLFVRFAHPYWRGLNRHHRLWVYVSEGTGFWGPPNRLGHPSEITLATLR